MDSTSSQHPVCVYCGTARPADETSCPTCGRSWIDVRVGEMTAGATAAAVVSADDGDTADDDSTEELTLPPADHAATPTPPPPPPPPPAPDDTGEFSFDDWTLPPERPRSRARWIVPIILLVAVIAVWVFVFVDRDSTPTTTAAAASTTTEATTTTTTAETTTTVEDTTTTEATTTTTTIAIPPPGVWPPVGDAIPTEDLVLRAEGIGPLDIGSGIGQIAGRLTASLGEAEASGTDEVCPPEAYWLQWGDLRVFFDGFESGATFVSYRYEDTGSETDLGLTTLSGLALGDTVEELQSIYSSFTITFEIVDGRDVFRLVDGAELLLWGPVTGTDPDSVVTGIYSPGPCVDG